jgi:alpha-ketoglutarate-dependent taurine dioxygenase
LDEQTKGGNAIVRPLSKVAGAEVLGLDLARQCDTVTAEFIRGALQKHHMLCIRNQSLSIEQLLEFSRLLGPLEEFPEKDKTKAKETIYNVSNVSPDGEHLSTTDPRVVLQKVNSLWHTDSSYRYIPSYASLLYSVEVLPDEALGGETEFSNMFAAYDALSDQMKQRIMPLHMVHSFEFGRRLFPDVPAISPEEREAVPPVSHPLVRVHTDRDHRRSLFITANAGNEISGMSLEAGQALHRELIDHISKEEFIYRHRWQDGDFVIWDNRCTLHRARPYDMDKYRRVFRRTTIAGSAPVMGPYTDAVLNTAA